MIAEKEKKIHNNHFLIQRIKKFSVYLQLHLLTLQLRLVY